VAVTSQRQIDQLADLGWTQLRLLFGGLKKRPPVYLFLSSKSKGSLKRRTKSEKDFVHLQQFSSGGVTLDRPPCAWVTDFDQVPEEVGHLFALTKGQRSTWDTPLSFYVLHEAFGRFAECLVFGSVKSQISSKLAGAKAVSDCNEIHRWGYRLGNHWGKALYAGQKKLDTDVWFSQHWTNPKIFKKLHELVDLTPPRFS